MSQFFDKLVEALQSEDDKPLYDSFVQICYNQLPPDTDERYQWLRSNGYVARDEDDINVYVAKVAGRHAPKFRWLYDNLFTAYPSVFQGEIDLVVWGCGCGLDLLALYDRAMQQKNPHLWLTVRSVTLIDKSEVALHCAKEIADLLFPLAKERIIESICDFTNSNSIKVAIPKSCIFTPHIHLVSNIIDLLTRDQLSAFVDRQRQCLARFLSGKTQFNEIFVAFSPEYRGEGWISSKAKMEAFRDAWGVKATSVIGTDNPPERCAFAAFTLNDCLASHAYQLYAEGNRCLRHLVRGLNRCLDDGCSDQELVGLLPFLCTRRFGSKNFFECYEWVDVQEGTYSGGRKFIDRILFAPLRESHVSAYVVYFNHNEMEPVRKAWGHLLNDNASSEMDSLSSNTKSMLWMNWKAFDVQAIAKVEQTDTCDFTRAFIIDPQGTKPLPALEELDAKQREIVFNRRQYRRIRGGAGCGKTTAMLWHGVMSILRTQQPVVMACRTVTLFNHNQRRMAATLLASVPGLEYVERDLIRFRTIDKYLCESIDRNGNCGIRHCGLCKRRVSEQLLHNRPKGICLKDLIPEQCIKDRSQSSFCRLIRGEIDGNLTREEKDGICDLCKGDFVKQLLAKNTALLHDLDSFGAVMVDEVQSVDPDMVQTLFNLTEAGNPRREFYVFCDERQCLKTNAIETDRDIKKLRVKTPRTSSKARFNQRWIVLDKPYRQMEEFSGVLSEVSIDFQKLIDAKYGENETERQLFQPSLGIKVFSVTATSLTDVPLAVSNQIKELSASGAENMIVLCDSPDLIYSLLPLNICPRTWNSTHRGGASFEEEQRLRANFEEKTGSIGLTTIELAQGWDFENVILVISKDPQGGRNSIEAVGTGITRAKARLRILDASPSNWVYAKLKGYN